MEIKAERWMMDGWNPPERDSSKESGESKTSDLDLDLDLESRFR